MSNNRNRDLERTSTYDLIAEVKFRSEGGRHGVGRPVRPVPELRDIRTNVLLDALRVRPFSIYGKNNLEDVEELIDLQKIKNARAVCAVFYSDDVKDNNDGATVALPTKTLANKLNDEFRSPPCGRVNYTDQPVGAVATAFLIGDDVIASAGHSIRHDNVDQLCIVFGYEASQDLSSLPKESVFLLQEICDFEITNSDADWVVARLTQSVSTDIAEPLGIRSAGSIQYGDPVYMIGHPYGLPKKHVADATVVYNNDPSYFSANLDAFSRNSGSPVINAVTHLVEGILVRGQGDFVKDQGCVDYVTYSMADEYGEDVTRISKIVLCAN